MRTSTLSSETARARTSTASRAILSSSLFLSVWGHVRPLLGPFVAVGQYPLPKASRPSLGVAHRRGCNIDASPEGVRRSSSWRAASDLKRAVLSRRICASASDCAPFTESARSSALASRSARKIWSRSATPGDENPSPLRDRDSNWVDRLERRGRICQRNTVGLNAGEAITRDTKADTSGRDTEPGICLLGDFRGLADALQSFAVTFICSA